jgi:hypothetical protein
MQIAELKQRDVIASKAKQSPERISNKKNDLNSNAGNARIFIFAY